MTIRDALKKYSAIEIELLLAHVLNKPKEFLFMNPDRQLSNVQINKLSGVAKRRQKGEPAAYILGYKDFCGLRFKVNKDVLIPRPETESIVERLGKIISGFVRGSGSYATILDIGTGSGCIIISLANTISAKNFIFFGSDVSEKALKVAKANAKAYHAPIKFIKSSLLKNIRQDFDIIIANLPYVWKAWKNNSSAETIGLKFEPKQALFAEEKGLKLIRQLLEQITKRKNKPKLVYLEFDPRQKKDLAVLIKKYLPRSKSTYFKDLAGLWRFVEICPIPTSFF